MRWRLALKGVWRCKVVHGIQGGDEVVWLALELKGGDGGACGLLGEWGEHPEKSIDEGPFQMGTIKEILTEGNEGSLHLGPERARVYSDHSPEDKERYNANIQATNILLQGLPKDIYTLINHYTDAKDIWDNAKMLLEGSVLTKEDHGQENTVDEDVDDPSVQDLLLNVDNVFQADECDAFDSDVDEAPTA
nr:integrase, catalytic region, zinc finger, CCHC-type, peptidase aspartic, catalytic [Tanacetum cinerariifolium]